MQRQAGPSEGLQHGGPLLARQAASAILEQAIEQFAPVLHGQRPELERLESIRRAGRGDDQTDVRRERGGRHARSRAGSSSVSWSIASMTTTSGWSALAAASISGHCSASSRYPRGTADSE